MYKLFEFYLDAIRFISDHKENQEDESTGTPIIVGTPYGNSGVYSVFTPLKSQRRQQQQKTNSN